MRRRGSPAATNPRVWKKQPEKLRKGISVWIREGSVAKDLKALAPLLTLATSTSVGFCTDDRNPLDIAREGHLDHLIRGVRSPLRSGTRGPRTARLRGAWPGTTA